MIQKKRDIQAVSKIPVCITTFIENFQLISRINNQFFDYYSGSGH